MKEATCRNCRQRVGLVRDAWSYIHGDYWEHLTGTVWCAGGAAAAAP